jgi:TRAP-type C4-dicarboxylate transport system substrate-binding protein
MWRHAYRFGLKGTVISLVAFMVGHADQSTVSAEEVMLKAVAPWPENVFFTKPLLTYIDWVNKELEGQVNVKYIGASDAVPAFEQFGALRNGVVDLALGSPGYFKGDLPIVQATQFSTRPKAELRSNGYFDLLRDIYRDKAQIVLLAETGGVAGGDFRYVFKQKIGSIGDFKGLKIRASQAYVSHIEALGGTAVIMKPSEMYIGLERGIVDGLGWPRMGLRDYALQEVTEYILNVPFFTIQTPILMNMDSWNELSPAAQQKMQELGQRLETWTERMYADAYKTEDDKLREVGMQFVRLSEADEKEFLKRAYDVNWKEIVAIDAELGPKLEMLGR